MKGRRKKGAEGRRIVDNIFFHKAPVERKEAEGFTQMMLEAPVPPVGPERPRTAPTGTYGSYYGRLGGTDTS